jgi:sec-independent protein translocase protein TatC
MSSALDEDTRQTLAAGRQTAGAMLRAAQKDLQKVFVVFLVGFLGTFYALQVVVWDFLKDVTKARMNAVTAGEVDIIAQTPFDVILLQAKISLTVGLLIAVPPFLYFARDALRARDAWPESPVARWKLAVLGLLVAGLFVLGVSYGYFFFFPFMFAFLANNAISAGFQPTYSIVKWAQFIFLLTLSFGLAAQMPLAITALSYAEIVPYETFRDKWRHAVVGIFVFGMFFSPPDPFTQIMWAAPLLVLYGASLYLAKVVVTARRGSEQVDLGAVARTNWNTVVGAAVLGFAALYFFYTRGGVEAANAVLAEFSSRRLLPAGSTLPLAPEAAAAVYGVVAGLLVSGAVLAYHVYAVLENSITVGPAAVERAGDPAELDLSGLDAAGIRAAPPEAFASLSESEAVDLAYAAKDEGDAEKARAILDRFDESHADADGTPSDEGGAASAETAAPTGTWGAPTETLGDVLYAGWERVDWRDRARRRWNLVLAAGVLAFGLVYAAYVDRGLGSYLVVRGLPDLGGLLGMPAGRAVLVAGAAVGVAVALLAAVAYAAYAVYDAGSDPTAADLGALSAAEVESAPAAVFADLTEVRANRVADRALAAGDEAKARAVLDRYDETVAAKEAAVEEAAAESEVGDRATRAGGTLLSELTEGDRDEDDIGGYYTDIAFIVDSLTSRAFRIVGFFAAVLAISFAWLYTGGLGRVFEDFLRRLPSEVTPESVNVVALHPVEALIFEVKFSTLVAALAVLPLLAYYAWPALRERNFVRGHRNVIFAWSAALLVGLAGGFVLGYTTVAPSVISWLAGDAVAADMVIKYRITNFFWLIFFTTAGIGLLADVPVLMALLNTAGVSYRTMRDRWREVTVGILTFSAIFTPASVVTMFLVTVPLMAAYGVGLCLLFVLTLGGRRDLSRAFANEA